MNKEQIIDEAYENYRKTILTEFFENTKELRKWATVEGPGGYTKEELINKCKTDTEFSEKWGLKIEERELSLEEKYDWIEDNTNSYIKANSLDYDLLIGNISLGHIKFSLSKEAPTKLTTITYNDKKIESYES